MPPLLTLDDVHDAIMIQLELPKPWRRTVAEDVAFRARLLAIIDGGEDDADVAAKLFRDAMGAI